MQNILILWNDQAAAGTLSGGSWETSLPLANMQTDRLSQRARSTDLALASTQFTLVMPWVLFGQRALVLTGTNLSVNYRYRVRAYDDVAKISLAYDGGWVDGFAPVPFGTLPWGHPSLWTGILPLDDAERGTTLIHVIDFDDWSDGVSERVWTVEIDDADNADGYVEIGRVFFGAPWQPALNFTPENSLTLRNAALTSTAMSGAESVWRRTNPRVFRFAFDMLTAAAVLDEAYAVMRDAGYDGTVFVIPDPLADARTMARQSFLGRLSGMDGIALAAAGYAGTGFEIKETI